MRPQGTRKQASQGKGGGYPNGEQEKDGGRGLFALIMILIGGLTTLIALFGVLNTALGTKWEFEVYGSSTPLPRYWDEALGLLIVGLLWLGLSYGLSTPGARRFMRNNKLVSFGVGLAVIMGFIFGTRACDQAIKEENERMRAYYDSLDAAGGLAARGDDSLGNKTVTRNYYADRKVQLVYTNPTLDTLELFVNGEAVGRPVDPMEIGKTDLKPGSYRIAAVAGGDTLDARTLEVPEGSKEDRSLHYVFNPKGGMSLALLDISDMYRSNKQRPKQTKANFELAGSWFEESYFEFNIERASVTLPRRATLGISYGTALKLVIIPKEWKDDDKKILAYAIWKYRLDDSRGFSQNSLDFYMLSPEERIEVVRNRLKSNIKAFEKQH